MKSSSLYNINNIHIYVYLSKKVGLLGHLGLSFCLSLSQPLAHGTFILMVVALLEDVYLQFSIHVHRTSKEKMVQPHLSLL